MAPTAQYQPAASPNHSPPFLLTENGRPSSKQPLSSERTYGTNRVFLIHRYQHKTPQRNLKFKPNTTPNFSEPLPSLCFSLSLTLEIFLTQPKIKRLPNRATRATRENPRKPAIFRSSAWPRRAAAPGVAHHADLAPGLAPLAAHRAPVHVVPRAPRSSRGAFFARRVLRAAPSAMSAGGAGGWRPWREGVVAKRKPRHIR